MTDSVQVLRAEISVASGLSETFLIPSRSVSGTPYSLSCVIFPIEHFHILAVVHAAAVKLPPRLMPSQNTRDYRDYLHTSTLFVLVVTPRLFQRLMGYV